MLVVENLTCSYGDVTVVNGISFSVGAGEIFGLIGANGAGKTTTIMSLAGHIPVKSGRVTLNGSELNDVPIHKRILEGLALVPEGRRLFPDLSVNDNLTVGATPLASGGMETNRQRVFDIFPRLYERKRQLAGSLSGGEQQMLAMGRGIMANPTLLLIDELSLGLMPKAIDECYGVLHRLRSEGIAIVLVEQSTERIVDTADTVAVLESGTIAWTGTGDEARGNSTIVDAYLGST